LNFRYEFKLKDFQPFDRLFKIQVSEGNDLYVFPALPNGSPLARLGFHVSHHRSGQSQLTLQQFPVSCLAVRPKFRLPFDRNEFMNDIVSKRKSLFSRLDLSGENKAGVIMVLKTESMINNFLNSTYMNNLLENSEYIDYYNLRKTNTCYPPQFFTKFFPSHFRNPEIDVGLIKNGIKTYEDVNIYELYNNLQKNKSIVDSDMIVLAPYEESSSVFMSGNGLGIRIDLENIEDTIMRMPGATPLYRVMRELVTRLS
jgi:hypothetical protein